MLLDNLPDILNVVIRHIENFLEAFEKSLDFEKFTLRIGLVKYRAMVQKSHFLKAKLFFKGS